jgi:hypothetical protein
VAGPVGAVVTHPRLSDVLGGLRIVVAQLRLYPKASAQVAKVGTIAFPPMLAYVEVKRKLTVGASPEGLLINGVRFPANDVAAIALEGSVLALLREASVKSFTLHSGISQDELTTFLHSLAAKFWEYRDGKKINQRLREENVTKAVVDEVEYVELNKDDLLLKDAMPKLEAAGFDTADLLRTVDDRLEVAIQHGKGDEAREGLFRKALEQDPALLGRIVKDGVVTARPGDAPGLITVDQALGAVRRIWKAMATAGPDTREALRGAAAAMLEPFRGTAAGLLAPVLASECPELVPDWMMGSIGATPEPAGVARSREILSLSPEARAEALLREGKSLFKELAAAGRQDLIERLVGIPIERIDSDKGRAKSQAVETLGGWPDILASEPLAKACEALRRKLRSTLEGEREATVYAKLVELAGLLLESRMQRYGSGGASDLLGTLRAHSLTSDPAFPDRAGLARGVAAKFQPSAPILPAVPVSVSSADRVAAALQMASLQFLVAQMKDMENVAERLELAETVARMGPHAAVLLVDELKKTRIPSEAVRLLEVLPWVATPDVAEQTLAGLLVHPVMLVRRRAALTLVERKYAGAEQALLATFDGKEPAGRIAVAEAMGKLKTDAALARLRAGAESREQTDDVRVACCAALAVAADPKAPPLLATLATPPTRGLTRIFRSVSPAVRAASTKALGAFSSAPEVRELLTRLTSDEDVLVVEAAMEAFRPGAKPKAAAVAAAVSEEPEPSQEITGFSGLISEIALDQICQVIGTSQKTGLLLVNFEGPTAKIFFEKGQIVSVDFQGRKDQDAFNALFTLKQGAFVFKPGERTLDPRVRLTADQALMAAFAASQPPTAA